LNEIYSPGVKMITIEDPVEYQLEGVNQMPVNPKRGLTFATGLRHILRHDPDIIMVGEIRDRETADIAVRAALTGHLVFSTLHTNDAPGAVTRLLTWARALPAGQFHRRILAQRLVRNLPEVQGAVSAGRKPAPESQRRHSMARTPSFITAPAATTAMGPV
jgi:type II secretory ATPase GspE/PulE/Tfp pilus assembly ATPase PilB-like protein